MNNSVYFPLLLFEFWPRLFGSAAPFVWIWNPVVGTTLSFVVAVAFSETRSTTARPGRA